MATIAEISDDPTILDSLSPEDAKNLIEEWEASGEAQPAGSILRTLAALAKQAESDV